jgi:osmotically-inducible protein OsmY
MLVTESTARENISPFLKDGSVKVPTGESFYRDGEIARVVVSTLKQNAMLPDGMVWVAVCSGWVTLRGQVEWDGQRAAAGVLTRCVPGVRGVTNAIAVVRYPIPGLS